MFRRAGIDFCPTLRIVVPGKVEPDNRAALASAFGGGEGPMMARRPDMPASAKPSKERTLPIDKDAFAERLWSAIKRSGLTYKETARRAQEHLPPGARISDVSVWSYAKGRSLPRRMTHVEALGKVLGIDTRELLGPEERAAAREGVEQPEVAFPPEVHVEDLGSGQALIRINQQVSWPVALEILRLVKGPDADDLDVSMFGANAPDMSIDDE